MKEPWVEGSTIIAEQGYIWKTKWEVGKPYVITKFQDAASNLIAVYCDVARPVEVIEGGFTFVDLYLDVWQVVGKDAVILDENELQDAVEAEYVSTEGSLMLLVCHAGVWHTKQKSYYWEVYIN